MKKSILLWLIVLGLSALVKAQTYTMSVSNFSVTTCAGTLLDPGGFGNYGNNQTRVITICPGTPGQVAQLTFTSFNTEYNLFACAGACDYVRVYDGPNTSSPQIGGNFSGSSLSDAPGGGSTISASLSPSNPNGCLTIYFDSDGSTTRSGFAANISCAAGAVSMPSSGSMTLCSGTFYDSGGSGSDYDYNDDRTFTICPSTAGNRAGVNFTSFNLENNYDFLYVYDGNSTSAPSLGVYTGTLGPGQVRATPSNPTGCLTFRFTSDGNFISQSTRAGWAGTISCIAPCATITSTIPSISPARQADGVVRICQGATVNFSGSATFSTGPIPAGTTYLWSFGDGTTSTSQNPSKTYSTAGSYVVNLRVTDPTGCTNSNTINQVIQVSSTPTMGTTVSPASVCVGQTATLTGSATPTPVVVNCTPPVSGTTFLPDGSGVSYTTSINVNCFANGQTIASANDIQNVCMTLEHSYLGDLNIRLICPSGRSTVLKSYGSGGATLYLGSPFDDPSTQTGTGANYCFAATGLTSLVGGPTITAGSPAGPSIAPGTYLPTESFSNLIGCPANGSWTIEVTDNLAQDDGWIFDWDLNFGPGLVPATSNSFTPTVASTSWQAASGLTSVNATTATVVPTAAGANNYTFQMVDNFGCTYTRPATVTGLAAPTPTIAGTATICNGASTSLTAGGGGTYSWSNSLGSGATVSVSPSSNTTYTVTVTGSNGCTSATSRSITVNTASAAIAGATSVCSGGSVSLTASGGGTYAWSNSLGSSATVNPSPVSATTYTVTASNASGCTGTASQLVSVNLLSTPPIPSLLPSTVCPNTNTLLSVAGGVAGAGSSIRWYSGPNGTGSLLGTGLNLTVAPTANTTYYIRREGTCNNTADVTIPVNVKNFIYAVNATTSNLYCTDNAGWKHFYVGDEIILSVQGDFSGMLPGFPVATIYDNGTYRQNPGTNPTAACAANTAGEERFEMARAWNLNTGLSTLVPPYNVRFYYRPTERTAIETAAANWMSTYASCGYTYKYATPLGFYWFKNASGTYIPPQYDGLHLTASNGTAGGTNYGQLTGITSFSGGSGAVILVPTTLLPVEYLYFTGEARGDHHHLSWKTASELENARFEVERSADGQAFAKIGEVAAGGTTTEAREYAFDDRNPLPATSYYRLRQVGLDGSTSYSNVIALSLGALEGETYNFFPNPTEQAVTYQFGIDRDDEVQIEVLD